MTRLKELDPDIMAWIKERAAREQEARRDLDTLAGAKGKFLLTTYPSDTLTQHAEQNGWTTINNEIHLCSSNTVGKNKVEVFTLNYSPKEGQLSLFG